MDNAYLVFWMESPLRAGSKLLNAGIYSSPQVAQRARDGVQVCVLSAQGSTLEEAFDAVIWHLRTYMDPGLLSLRTLAHQLAEHEVRRAHQGMNRYPSHPRYIPQPGQRVR